MGFEYLFIAFSFGLATAIIGKGKGSSFWLWLIIGTVVPVLGLVAVILFRSEKVEPERRCPTCGKTLKLYVQVCPRCGTDLYLPDSVEPAERFSAARSARSRWRSRGRSGPPPASSNCRGGGARR